MYFLNLSRIFPADLPTPNSKEHLTKLIRPELVKSYRIPLSSDAYQDLIPSPPDAELNNIEVAAASQHLYKVVIPNFAKDLDMLELMPVDSESLTKELHKRGINARYLGIIAELTKLPHVRDLMVVEMVARCCKKTLRRSQSRLLKQHKNNPTDTMLKMERDAMKEFIDQEMNTLTITMFNIVLGSGRQSVQFWENVLIREVYEKFHYRVQHNTIHKPNLFISMQYHVRHICSDFCSSHA